MKEHMRIRAEINLDAIDNNLEVMLRHLKDGVKICAVIKADAYGHGALAIAKHIEQRPYIWGFAVATPGEGEALRRGGITRPILLLGYSFPEDYETIIDCGLRACIFEEESAALLAQCARKAGKEAIVHIALDTGMSRIGFQVERGSAGAVKRIADMDGIKVEGLFTHFARCDEPSLEPARKQFERYSEFLGMLEEEDVNIPVRHVCNSAGIMRYPEADLDLTRAGITLYGLTPSDEIADEMRELGPVMKLVSHVSHVKTLPKGREISYGGTYVTKGDTRVATIPAGYADGYPRMLSGKGSVLITGRRAPILGRVCMDQFMVDVTDIPDVQRGDTVALLDDHVSILWMANLLDVNVDEIVCNISKRVPRVYEENPIFGGNV
ncbi:MAG: alanine racemase [Lachnospiraceae bacterium]|nr:alanine racemase [Lachnospiraceae bacterium]